jgi:soluble lytic murein transglycosylase-like protein
MFRGFLYARSTFALGLMLICAAPAPCRADTVSLSTVPISVFAATLRTINPHLAVKQSLIYAQALLSSSRRWRLDPSLVMALVAVESSWNSHAVSYSGAQGLGQLKPETARGLGVDPKQVHGNLNGTTRYLRQLMRVFHSSSNPIRDALAGYNAGPETVRIYGGVPPIYETQRYVVKVMGTWHTLRHRMEAHATKASPQSPGSDSSALAYWGVR